LETKEQYDRVLDRILYLGSDNIVMCRYFEAFYRSKFEYTGPRELICYLCDLCRSHDECADMVNRYSIDEREKCLKYILSVNDYFDDIITFLVLANSERLHHYIVDYAMINIEKHTNIINDIGSHCDYPTRIRSLVELCKCDKDGDLNKQNYILNKLISFKLPSYMYTQIASKFIKTINKQYENGNTIAHSCADEPKILKLLIDMGYDVSILNDDGKTATDLMLNCVSYY